MTTSTRPLFDEDHDAFRETVRRFLAVEVVPHLDEWRVAGRVPTELLLTAGENGLLGTAVPEDLGGGGTDDLRFTAVLVEETAAVGATGLALTFAVHAGVCLPLLLRHGSAAQCEAWVPGLATGEKMAVTAAIGAPVAAGRDDDQIVLDASVQGVSGGIYAGLLVTAVEIDGDVRLLLVSGEDEIEACELVVDSLAARDAGQADLVLAARLSAERLVAAGDSLAQLRRDLDLWAAVLGVAAARSVLAMTLDYVRERQVFGRPLSEFENTRHMLAEVSAGIESAQLFVDTCLERRGHGTLTSADAATARLGSGLIHDRSVDQGMQLHGGYGYMREYPISHAFADARYLRNHSSAGSNALEAIAAGLGI